MLDTRLEPTLTINDVEVIIIAIGFASSPKKIINKAYAKDKLMEQR